MTKLLPLILSHTVLFNAEAPYTYQVSSDVVTPIPHYFDLIKPLETNLLDKIKLHMNQTYQIPRYTTLYMQTREGEMIEIEVEDVEESLEI